VTEASEKIGRYHAIRPTEYPLLSRLELRQPIMDRTVGGLAMLLELAREGGTHESLVLTFDEVTNLSIEWPEWSSIRVDVIEIEDISDRQLEGQRYRAYEGSGLFSLSCKDFNVTIR
jgi:hypothetical protein